MRSLFPVSGGVVVILVAVIVNDCGSSPNADQQATSESQAVYEASAEAITSPESLLNAVPIETAVSVSGLEIANVRREPLVRDEESKALIVTFADLNLKAVLGKELITAEDVKRRPNWLNALNGEKIRIRGFMSPTFEETGIERFVLDHSPRMMNFGADPKNYELIQVDLVAGTTTNSVRAGQSIEVIGRLRISFDAHDGTIPMLYFLEDGIVVVPKAEEGTERMSPTSALKISNASPKTFTLDVETGLLNVTFTDLNLRRLVGSEQLSEEDLQLLPDWLNALNGKKIRIRGYMFPTFDEVGIETFYLDLPTRSMNFGAEPKIYELICVNLAKGTTTNYVPRSTPIDVVGRFRIEPQFADGKICDLYFLDDAALIGPKVD